MRTKLWRKTFALLGGVVLFLSGVLLGQESGSTQKTVLHVAAWTARDGITQQDLDTFQKESETITSQVPGLKRVWVGKLRQPLTVDGIQRNHAVVLEFDDLKSREAYTNNRPARWYDGLNRLRQPGSTNFDVVGE